MLLDVPDCPTSPVPSSPKARQLPTTGLQVLLPRQILMAVPVCPASHTALQLVPAVVLEQLLLQTAFCTCREGPVVHTEVQKVREPWA
jgi:hypothetical protein